VLFFTVCLHSIPGLQCITHAPLAEFNASMFDYYKKVSLYQCEHCGRSFNEEAFAKHQTMCTAETPGGPHAKREPGKTSTMGTGPSRIIAKASPATKDPASKPRAYTCYLCGQQYGSKSLMIHVPQCQEKWLQKEEQKPKNERRKLPLCPSVLDDPLPTDPAGIDEFNSTMFSIYNGVSLCQCPHCGRSFNEEAFKTHQKMCTAETPGGPHAKRKPGQSSGFGAGPSRMATGGAAQSPGGGPLQKPRAYVCYLCGQQYGSRRCE
jgi:hypothetical protein